MRSIARDSIPEISQKNFYWWDREDNGIWYQMWLTDLEKGCIDGYFLDMEG